MSDFLQNIDFLKHFSPRVLVFDRWFIDRLDRYLLTSQLMNSKGDLTKSTFAQKFDKFVKIKRGWWDLIMFFYVGFDILN
jgi:hypothetical protein